VKTPGDRWAALLLIPLAGVLALIGYAWFHGFTW
jgi:hypothetical protein